MNSSVSEHDMVATIRRHVPSLEARYPKQVLAARVIVATCSAVTLWLALAYFLGRHGSDSIHEAWVPSDALCVVAGFAATYTVGIVVVPSWASRLGQIVITLVIQSLLWLYVVAVGLWWMLTHPRY